MRFSEDAAHRSAEFRANIANGRYPPAQSPGATTSSFFKELDISPMDLEMAQAKTEEALSFQVLTESVALEWREERGCHESV
jgi:hypothetical protein